MEIKQHIPSLPIKHDTDLQVIVDKDGNWITDVHKVEYAEFIVKACNSHDELVKRSKELRTAIMQCDKGVRSFLGCEVINLNIAIAKAEVKL